MRPGLSGRPTARLPFSSASLAERGPGGPRQPCWAQLDWVVEEAAEREMLVFLVLAYLGFGDS